MFYSGPCTVFLLLVELWFLGGVFLNAGTGLQTEFEAQPRAAHPRPTSTRESGRLADCSGGCCGLGSCSRSDSPTNGSGIDRI
jgi:hypothetical protein